MKPLRWWHRTTQFWRERFPLRPSHKPSLPPMDAFDMSGLAPRPDLSVFNAHAFDAEAAFPDGPADQSFLQFLDAGCIDDAQLDDFEDESGEELDIFLQPGVCAAVCLRVHRALWPVVAADVAFSPIPRRRQGFNGRVTPVWRVPVAVPACPRDVLLYSVLLQKAKLKHPTWDADEESDEETQGGAATPVVARPARIAVRVPAASAHASRAPTPRGDARAAAAREEAAAASNGGTHPDDLKDRSLGLLCDRCAAVPRPAFSPVAMVWLCFARPLCGCAGSCASTAGWGRASCLLTRPQRS